MLAESGYCIIFELKLKEPETDALFDNLASRSIEEMGIVASA